MVAVAMPPLCMAAVYGTSSSRWSQRAKVSVLLCLVRKWLDTTKRSCCGCSDPEVALTRAQYRTSPKLGVQADEWKICQSARQTGVGSGHFE